MYAKQLDNISSGWMYGRDKPFSVWLRLKFICNVGSDLWLLHWKLLKVDI